MPKISRHRGITPGRHHFGTPGDIISECLGEFVGIRRLAIHRRESAGGWHEHRHRGGCALAPGWIYASRLRITERNQRDTL
jgi:hypothetical protein